MIHPSEENARKLKGIKSDVENLKDDGVDIRLVEVLTAMSSTMMLNVNARVVCV